MHIITCYLFYIKIFTNKFTIIITSCVRVNFCILQNIVYASNAIIDSYISTCKIRQLNIAMTATQTCVHTLNIYYILLEWNRKQWKFQLIELSLCSKDKKTRYATIVKHFLSMLVFLREKHKSKNIKESLQFKRWVEYLKYIKSNRIWNWIKLRSRGILLFVERKWE